MNIFLTRHGETEWNLEQRMQGRLDSPLTPHGIRQAQSLAARLKREPLIDSYQP
ncbi:histidine phosphatase family protein [Kroppenstedtia sanguinis]|uniref:Histidine phosphatase family protein n=1 Tax=Kroppenstedtia sanguinis TaxID=1380684 RepID=A0ABW4C628_9BACL